MDAPEFWSRPFVSRNIEGQLRVVYANSAPDHGSQRSIRPRISGFGRGRVKTGDLAVWRATGAAAPLQLSVV
jgi:hypothetical protein